MDFDRLVIFIFFLRMKSFLGGLNINENDEVNDEAVNATHGCNHRRHLSAMIRKPVSPSLPRYEKRINNDYVEN